MHVSPTLEQLYKLYWFIFFRVAFSYIADIVTPACDYNESLERFKLGLQIARNYRLEIQVNKYTLKAS